MNQVSKMSQVSRDEFLGHFDKSVHDSIRKVLERYSDAEAIVMFENVTLDSSHLREKTAVVVGPSNTFKGIEFCEGKWLHDLPSQKQYPWCYCLRSDFLGKEKE